MKEMMSTLLMRLRSVVGGLPRTGRGRVARLAGAGAVVCGVALWTNIWVDVSASSYIHESMDDVPDRKVAIVPGCRVYRDGTPTATLEDRLIAALELYRAGKVSRILVSGDHAAPEYDEVNAMWRWLEARHVPAKDVFLDHAGLRTLDTMARAAEVFGVDSAVVCTQRFHLPRSVFLARRQGIDAVGLVADRREYRKRYRNKAREFVAKSVSFMDSYVFRTRPTHGGPEISINGDGVATHDQWSR